MLLLAAKQGFAWHLLVVGLALFLLFTVLETTRNNSIVYFPSLTFNP